MKTRRRGALRLVAGALIAVGMVAAAAGAVSAASTATVNVREVNNRYQFSPGTTFVSIGGTVTWSNGTDAPHTVTSDSGGVLASSQIAAGASFSHTFTATGTFAYHCSIHPYMVGSVVVLAANATPPGTDTAPAGTPRLPGHQEPLLAVLAAGVLGLGILVLRLRPSRS